MHQWLTKLCQSNHNQQIEIFWRYNAQLRFHEKRFDVRLTDGSEKYGRQCTRSSVEIWGTLKMNRSRNMRNPKDEPVQHLNCHAKHSTTERYDLYGHDKQEMSKQVKGSKTQYFLLTQSNRITRGHLWPNGTIASAAITTITATTKPSKRFSKH